MANYYTKFAFAFDVGVENVDRAMKIAEDMRDEPEKFGLDSFSVDVAPSQTQGAIKVDDDTNSDLDGAVAFIRECGKQLELTGIVEFKYANDCDAARFDAYGGGAVSIDLATGETLLLDTSEALEIMRHPEFQETFRQMLQDVRDEKSNDPSPA